MAAYRLTIAARHGSSGFMMPLDGVVRRQPCWSFVPFLLRASQALYCRDNDSCTRAQCPRAGIALAYDGHAALGRELRGDAVDSPETGLSEESDCSHEPIISLTSFIRPRSRGPGLRPGLQSRVPAQSRPAAGTAVPSPGAPRPDWRQSAVPARTVCGLGQQHALQPRRHAGVEGRVCNIG